LQPREPVCALGIVASHKRSNPKKELLENGAICTPGSSSFDDASILDRCQPTLFLECKWGDADVSKGLTYLKERFPATEAIQIHATGKKNYETARGIKVQPAVVFLRTLV
jgi:hypothetical protein